MEITLEKLRYMMGFILGGEVSYQDAWVALEEWLEKYEAAQQGVQADETTGHPITDAVQDLVRYIESDEV